MKRVAIALAVLVLGARVVADNRPGSGRFDLVEATIPSMQTSDSEQHHHRRSTRADVPRAHRRLRCEDDGSASELVHPRQPATLSREAREANGGRANGYQKRPLFGIPMILKDNIDTKNMPTTAGSVAFAGSIPQSDAFVTKKLLDAGAIILGKATMTEFANFLTNGMPAGYSSLGGYGYNPYDPRPDPRDALDDALGRPLNDGRPVLTPGGSSSGPGIAVAANLATVGIGTETSGSILSPGTANMLVGIKPTVGLISRDGIIPIVADQDTAGPLARTVTRCGDRARRHRRVRSERSGDRCVPDAGKLLQRLHAVSRCKCAPGRAHRGAAVPRESRGGHERTRSQRSDRDRARPW